MFTRINTFPEAEITERLPRPLPAFARAQVLAIAALVAALLLVLAARYDYVTDELYFLAAGKFYPAWGYMDQQPLVPLLAAFLDRAFPGSLLVFRLPSALVTALGVIVTALLTRELGGGARAQTLAAAAYSLSPWLLLNGHWLTAATMEPLQWTTMLWLLARWTRLTDRGIRRDRLLVHVGLVATLALQTKFQVVALIAALLLSIAIVGPRSIFGRPLLWVAAAIPSVTAIPTLWWQATNGWPALDMSTAVNNENDRLFLLPTALFYAGIAVGAVFCCYGLAQLLRAPALKPFRFLGWTTIMVFLCFLLAGGRPNYVAGLYGLLFAAAAVGLQHRTGKLHWPAYLLSAVLPLAVLPIYPLDFLARHPEFPSYPRLYETGWPTLADTVARAYRALPPDQQRHTVLIAENYYLAGALDVYDRKVGLPRAYSPHRGYWFFGAPPETADTVLYVGNQQPLARYFGQQRELATVETGLVNVAQGNTLTLYQGPKQQWSSLWPRIRTI
ncbi:glycosyltransferase family 39 protein [Saccharopolyspora sp. K220]|uniref:ArnT family glycosyltransferase n=1 Tax=Saccharopolyspora soli TaxID=2926618 RepID=UPI001F56F7E5|nr:glycosyltransferase family 39 protein [Saccharopolyspora soli]MCI2417510.1 glycosyltransferase family 39 protein [Saccharopolyspora soli]